MVIIGYGENALQTARAFDDESMMGKTLVALLTPDDRERMLDSYADRHGGLIPRPTLGAVPERSLAHFGNPHVVLALETGGIEIHQNIMQRLGRRSEYIQIVPSLRGLPLYGMEVDHFFVHEVLLAGLQKRANLGFARAFSPRRRFIAVRTVRCRSLDWRLAGRHQARARLGSRREFAACSAARFAPADHRAIRRRPTPARMFSAR